MRGPELIEEAVKMAEEFQVDEPNCYIAHYPSLCADYLRGLTWETIWREATASYLQSLKGTKWVDWLIKRDAAIEAKDTETYLPMYRNVALHYAEVRMARYPELQAYMPKPSKRQRRTPVDACAAVAPSPLSLLQCSHGAHEQRRGRLIEFPG